jgi:serine/threonine protein kinase
VSLGTPGFMPPEQARGRTAEIDAQSDLWALGATFFAVLSGRQVHEAETANEQLLKAMTEPAPPLSEVAPAVPAPVAAIVDRALRYKKEERWPSAAVMQQAVRQAYADLQGVPINSARLSAPMVRVSRSVHPDAPTLAADLPEMNRMSTTRPVSDRGDEQPPERSRAWLGVAAALLLVAAAVIAWMASLPLGRKRAFGTGARPGQLAGRRGSKKRADRARPRTGCPRNRCQLCPSGGIGQA